MAFVIIHQQRFARDFPENFAHSAVRNKVDYYYWKFLLVSVAIYAINCAKDKNPLSSSQIRICFCESSHCKGFFCGKKIVLQKYFCSNSLKNAWKGFIFLVKLKFPKNKLFLRFLSRIVTADGTAVLQNNFSSNIFFSEHNQ